MKYLGSDQNFLGLENERNYNFSSSAVVIQSLPYEHSSSCITGSSKGPKAIISASHFVEFYDEELDKETCFEKGICTLPITDFEGIVNEAAMNIIEKQTANLLAENKFIVSFGAEHTISYGIIKAFNNKFKDISVLQIDAHSDLRSAYQGSKWSHASVMARVHELGIPLTQIGIRAQCKEETELIKKSKNIHTFYNHQLYNNIEWMQKAVDTLQHDVYISIDADGFDPAIMPAVGTAEPGGLKWQESLEFFKLVFAQKNVLGFDIVECAPKEGEILTEFNLAKLAYKLIGLKYIKK